MALQQVISKDEFQDIKAGMWDIESIEGHPAHIPIGPELSFLCVWKDTVWNTKDVQINAFMEKKVQNRKYLLTPTYHAFKQINEKYTD